MDEGTKCSALVSVEDNELTNHINNPHLGCSSNGDGDGNEVEVNGLCLDDMGIGGDCGSDGFFHDDQVKSVEIEQQGNSVSSPQLASKSPDGGSPPPTKGYGLRKWKRRARRDLVKDGNQNLDSSKVLKRGLSGPSDPSKPTNLNPINGRQNSEGSVGSTNATRVGVPEGFLTQEYNLESRFAIGSAFATGTDSENSEDRSSKSSTAASAPRLRHDLPAMLGHIREKNRIKNLSSKAVSGSSPRGHQGKGKAESSKKPRGERVNIEKENSHSSIESDSRSSKFVFMQGVYSMTFNGKQSESSMNYDEENSDDAHADEPEFGDEAQTGFGEENVGEVEDSRDGLAAEASWEEKEEKTENHLPSKDQDPLVESILALHTVQEALENELKKLGEIGKASSLPETSTFHDPGVNESRSSDEFDPGNVRQPSSLESEVLSLKANAKNLENRLVEATDLLKVKELRITELENTLNSSILPKEESLSLTETHPKNSRDMEIELEGLFKQKIEAEIVYLALTRTIQKLRVASGDQFTLLEEQEALAVEQSQMLKKLGRAENKAATLKKEAEDLEKYCADILGTKEVMQMQKKVCNVTTCFLMQLVLLFLVIYLLLLQLSPHSGVVVPT